MFESQSRKWWHPPAFGWKIFNYLLIGIGLIVGFGVWLTPNQQANPEYQAALERYRKAAEYRKALAAQEAEHKRMVDELGLIYIEPGTNPFLPPAAPKQD